MQIQSHSSVRFDTSTRDSSSQIRSSWFPQPILRARTLITLFALTLAVVANQSRALAQAPPPMPPWAQNDWQVTDYYMETFIDVTLNDSPGSEPLDLSTVQITMQPFFGTVTVDPVTGVVAYVPDGDYAGQDWFEYTVKDTLGQESTPATVTIELMNMPPMITDFHAYPAPNGTWTFTGRVWDENPEAMTVRLSGLVDFPNVEVEIGGYFSVITTLGANDFGTVFANTEDEVGMPSNTALETAGYYD